MRRTTVTILAAPFALFAIACGSSGTDTQGPGAQDSAGGAPAGGKEKTVVMEVTGPATADVTFGLGADQSQEVGAKLPWKKELKSSEAILITALVAQSKGDGEIACKITVDGEVKKENKSTGQFAVVTCTG